MKILDLIEKSRELNTKHLVFKVSKFPDGQQTIDLSQKSDLLEDVTIKSRLNTFRDLELIICATAALKNLNTPNIHLYVPYFIGARSDRKFVDGGVNYLKDVISPIINLQGYKSVTILDPHSDVLEATINNFKKVDNINLVKWSLTDIDNTNSARENLFLVSPDAGALKKVYNVAEKFQIDNIIVANKHRDIRTGKITHTEVPNLDENPGKRKYVIVDDICDGGRTFIEIAKVILEKRPKSMYGTEIYLVVTHGIFSAGFLELSKYFDRIYSTNSYSDVNVEEISDYTVNKDFLKQLNIF
jgi:ribose-phosphate pyrophosphokinase